MSIDERITEALVSHHREHEPGWCRRIVEATAVVLDRGPWTRVLWGWPGRVSVLESAGAGWRVVAESAAV